LRVGFRKSSLTRVSLGDLLPLFRKFVLFPVVVKMSYIGIKMTDYTDFYESPVDVKFAVYGVGVSLDCESLYTNIIP
jgi:hypothetical protein